MRGGNKKGGRNHATWQDFVTSVKNASSGIMKVIICIPETTTTTQVSRGNKG